MNRQAEITFINVGYGESILLKTENRTILIDGGSNEREEYMSKSGRIRAIDFLKERKISHLDAVIITHIHEDHLCGLIPIFQNLDVAAVFSPFPLIVQTEEFSNSDNLPENLEKSLTAINDFFSLNTIIPRERFHCIVSQPTEIQFDGLSIRIFSSSPQTRSHVFKQLRQFSVLPSEQEKKLQYLKKIDAAMNNCSLILQIKFFGKTILLPGDTNAAGLENLLKTCPSNLKADIFKIGHHGQADSINAELLDAISPGIVICSASNDGRYGSFNAIVQDELRKRDIIFARTDPDLSAESARHGIEITVDQQSAEATMRSIG